MAEAAAQPGKHGEQRGGYRVRATWQAIRRLPLENFPLMLPHVHPVAAFFILRRLKRLGFSNCKVVTTTKGLVVHAQR
ncbi:hypothetical protein F6V30_06980 [Oryzomonas sagensis]|uniref:Uncharacterized protein n=1 Tax=Oryzomonas sagensis TaxID=2603857 RepID=A0ABQ6TTG1_9BACT|nr:hypothetical protein [Oryzomonas sagensis]KAB0672300.1 hypothetical protein F6V30_06980 [Oryzomonas sagensis]